MSMPVNFHFDGYDARFVGFEAEQASAPTFAPLESVGEPTAAPSFAPEGLAGFPSDAPSFAGQR